MCLWSVRKFLASWPNLESWSCHVCGFYGWRRSRFETVQQWWVESCGDSKCIDLDKEHWFHTVHVLLQCCENTVVEAHLDGNQRSHSCLWAIRGQYAHLREDWTLLWPCRRAGFISNKSLESRDIAPDRVKGPSGDCKEGKDVKKQSKYFHARMISSQSSWIRSLLWPVSSSIFHNNETHLLYKLQCNVWRLRISSFQLCLQSYPLWFGTVSPC